MGRFSWIAELFGGEDEDGGAGGGESKGSSGSKSSAGGSKPGGGRVKPKRKGRFSLGGELKTTIPHNASGPMIEDKTPKTGLDLTIGGLIPGIPSNASGPMIEDKTPWGSAAAPLSQAVIGTRTPSDIMKDLIGPAFNAPYADPIGIYPVAQNWPPNSVSVVPPTTTPLYPVPSESRFGANIGDTTLQEGLNQFTGGFSNARAKHQAGNDAGSAILNGNREALLEAEQRYNRANVEPEGFSGRGGRMLGEKATPNGIVGIFTRGNPATKHIIGTDFSHNPAYNFYQKQLEDGYSEDEAIWRTQFLYDRGL
jgi:hypothetical protein